MNKKSLPLALALLLFNYTFSFSQGIGQTEETKKDYRIHLAPLNLLDPATSVLQIGIQKSINQRFAVLVDYGFKTPLIKVFGFDASTGRENYTYSKTKAELKYFLNLNKSNFWSGVFPYLSLEGMYLPQSYTKVNNWIQRGDIDYMYSSSDIKRTVFVTSLKWGFENHLSKVIIDTFIGIGLRQITIKHQTVGEVEVDFEEPIDLYFPPLDRSEGTFLRPHISFGVKIGYPVW